MHAGRLVFSQVIDHFPMHTFRRCVARYDGNRYKKTFSCLDQYLCMAFAPRPVSLPASIQARSRPCSMP